MKVWDRLQQLMVKKENAILNHFMQSLNESAEFEEPQTDEVAVLGQLQELRQFSPQLAQFAQRLQVKIKKMEAV